MSGMGDRSLHPPGLDVGHRWRMHRLWMNQELWSSQLLQCQQDLWEESLGKHEKIISTYCVQSDCDPPTQ